ncbi:NADPH-dependent FMN reductase [Nocardia sp. NPDC005998]|uniref:NADPH-dependent FMN reductase n=1 Tax=Nocardia sp. NPDC005998 TaxID=3156894 RepID=UPI00339EE862
MTKQLEVLAISGSLRAGSYNTALLRAAARIDCGMFAIRPETQLGRLPLYNQDLDTDPAPGPVIALRERVAAADALLIATPEHNSSIPAALKNAIDWISTASGALLLDKPIAIAGASPGQFGSIRAQQALRQVLASVGADVVAKPDVAVFRSDTRFTGGGALTDPRTTELLRDLLAALAGKLRPRT